jgi:cell volume regulation protein A
MLLVGTILLLICILSSKLSFRLGIPSLLLFLLIGVLAGSEDPGGLYFDGPFQSLAPWGSDPGFSPLLRWPRYRWEQYPTGPVERRHPCNCRCVAITAINMDWFATIVLGFSITEDLLLGTIVSSIDAAAVFALLRSRRISLRRDLRHLLDLETGSNGPPWLFPLRSAPLAFWWILVLPSPVWYLPLPSRWF